MTIAQPATTWHDNIAINGQPYPTRHPAPLTSGSASDYLNVLTDHQRDQLRAHHEAAHAVAGLSAGAHVHHAKISTTATLKAASAATDGVEVGGNCLTCNLPPQGNVIAIYFGAGERTEDHWLHQHNLWTPWLAVGIEFGAYGDRQSLLHDNPHVGFGDRQVDYRLVHDLADAFVTTHWTAITAVGEALATRLYLTGDEIADLAQLPNGTCTHPAT
ncbi:hypothetical protein [Streptomyces tendae]|uniref:hypothetical protein n=1 Tax=Streptomyces tendae TaxID=1932 RepID=UPI00381B6B22